MKRGGGTRTAPAHDALALSALEVAAAAAAGWLIVARHLRPGGAAVLLAGLAGAGASLLADRAAAPRPTFVAETADRVLDAAALGALAWVALVVDVRVAAGALFALGSGGTTAYLRARGRGLGYSVPLWPAYRAARTALVAAGLLLVRPGPSLAAVVVLDLGVGTARWLMVAREGA